MLFLSTKYTVISCSSNRKPTQNLSKLERLETCFTAVLGLALAYLNERLVHRSRSSFVADAFVTHWSAIPSPLPCFTEPQPRLALRQLTASGEKAAPRAQWVSVPFLLPVSGLEVGMKQSHT